NRNPRLRRRRLRRPQRRPRQVQKKFAHARNAAVRCRPGGRFSSARIAAATSRHPGARTAVRSWKAAGATAQIVVRRRLAPSLHGVSGGRIIAPLLGSQPGKEMMRTFKLSAVALVPALAACAQDAGQDDTGAAEQPATETPA